MSSLLPNPRTNAWTRLGLRRTHPRAASLVEFALVLPVLLLLVSGIIQFGLVLHAQLILTEASSQATRYATLGKTPTEIEEKVTELLQPVIPVGGSTNVVSVAITRATSESGESSVSVAVAYDYPISMPLLNTIFPDGNAHLSSTSTMRTVR